MKKEKVLKITLISLISVAAAALLSLLVARAFFRPVKYYVLVEDSFYKENEDKFYQNPEEKYNYLFISDSAFQLKNQKFFGSIPSACARISTESSIRAFSTAPSDSATDFYIELEKTDLLPYIKGGEEAEKKAEQDFSPSFVLNFSTVEELPENSRAIPVDDLYAGSEAYPLRSFKRLCVQVYRLEFYDELKAWCVKNFSSDNEVSSKKKLSEPVFIASVGDIMIARGVEDILINEEDGLKKVFGDTLPLLQNNDFTIGNLEGVVTQSWKNATKTYTFKFKKQALPVLMNAGFDYLMQTNNHCYDYGEPGFKDTLEAFSEYNIPSSGIGKNEEEAKKFYHTELNGLKIAVISCGAFPVERSGFNGKTTATAKEDRAGILWESDELLELIKAEKDAGYFVIVNVHGGEEYHFKPSKKQRELYESFCDSGASIVFGSHPHVLQPTEFYNGSLIVYSMGNFIFNGMEGMYGATDTEIVRVGVLDGRVAYVEQYPAKIDGKTVALN